ncbi:LysR family transcriptional regulator [Acetobacter estunensis]|uniref:LysR family transcriptional regulator n=1 Tax=Acetobacter estunensis TaxID=104097 RepID=UPI001C2DDEDB|nr:LysR family transcriptional regulator [Acetobacter estunensis]MBV1838328.1 LysR family transcriptional regulator [Acetobacter estunensis]
MTLEQLRIFVAVAEREHMTAAARALNITQSAVSAAISALEERHGIRLFHRVGRGISLSEAGRLFLDEARAVLARASAAENVLDELGGLRRGTLRVVASQTIAAYWLPPIFALFRKRYPLLGMELSIGNTQQTAAKVHAGEADLGFVEGKVDDPTLAHWPVGEDRLLLVGSEPFGKREINAAWLRKAHWVTREPGSGTRSTLDESLRKIGVDPDDLHDVLVLPSNEAVRTAVESGAGIAALSALVVQPALVAGRLHAAPLEFGPRVFFGLRHKERYCSKATDAFLDLMEEYQAGR